MPDSPIAYSFCLYIAYLLLPIIPATVIFWMFPQTKVAVSGPLQHLTFRASGAFAAYIVTASLGYWLAKNIELQIDFARHPVYYGVFVDLERNQAVQSDRMLWNCTESTNQHAWHNCAFAVPLDSQVGHTEPVFVHYYESDPNEASGFGEKKPTETLTFTLVPTRSYPPRYRLFRENGHLLVKPESEMTLSTASN